MVFRNTPFSLILPHSLFRTLCSTNLLSDPSWFSFPEHPNAALFSQLPNLPEAEKMDVFSLAS